MNPSASSSSSKRRRRQTITALSQVDQAEEDCQIHSGNDVISCFPTATNVFPQHQWASFVWNSRRPQLLQLNKVDIFLFRADSQEQILHFPDVDNPSDRAGVVRAQVNDTWFAPQGASFSGTNISFPFYWVLLPADKTLDGNQIPQPIFTAVQTAVLDSVAQASSSSAAAASSSSSARAASLSSLAAHPSTASSGASPTGNVQHASSDSSFPHWAIAVIVVLGFLAIAATCILAFLILRRLRRRQQHLSSSRNSMGSASPMMPREGPDQPDMIQRYDSAGSPLIPPTALASLSAGAGVGAGAASSTGERGAGGPGSTTHDGASAISDTGGPFSGADAAIMADAFRKMLRKPDFATRPVEEGESPEQEGANNGPGGGGGAGPDEDGDEYGEQDDGDRDTVLRGQLAEEGRDIRSVSSSRGVRVEDPGPGRPISGETS